MPTRVSAGTYTFTMSLAVVLWSLATKYLSEVLVPQHLLKLSDLQLWVAVLGAVFGALFWSMSVGRMRDLNFPKWVVYILAFPLCCVIVLPLLCFLPGPPWANNYGDAPKRSSIPKLILACALFALAIRLSFSALYAYHRAEYLLSAGTF